MEVNSNKDYIGKVTYINDVTHTGRCKIRVFGVFDSLEDETLPWFVPGNTTKFSSDGGGSIDIPKVGSIVRVKFTNGDFYSGEYYSLPMLDPSLVKEIEDDYEDTHVLLYDGDQELLIIYQRMTGLKIFHKNASIILDPTGNIQLKHQNNTNVIEINQNDIKIVTTGNNTANIEISCDNTVEINASTIKLNSPNIICGNGSSSDKVALADKVSLAFNDIIQVLNRKMPFGDVGGLPSCETSSLSSTVVKTD